jgi:predicted RNA binding protein YcfA (HicA-like mRNA interferase family)
MNTTLSAPGEEATQVGPGVLAGRTSEPGQIGGDGPVKLSGGLPGVSGNRGEFMLDHDPTLRPLRAAAIDMAVPQHVVRQSSAERPVKPGLTVPCQGMAKAVRILTALKRDGWIETRRSGSHRVMAKGDQQRIWAYHDGVDLGGLALARIARDYGYTVDELRKL